MDVELDVNGQPLHKENKKKRFFKLFNNDNYFAAKCDISTKGSSDDFNTKNQNKLSAKNLSKNKPTITQKQDTNQEPPTPKKKDKHIHLILERIDESYIEMLQDKNVQSEKNHTFKERKKREKHKLFPKCPNIDHGFIVGSVKKKHKSNSFEYTENSNLQHEEKESVIAEVGPPKKKILENKSSKDICDDADSVLYIMNEENANENHLKNKKRSHKDSIFCEDLADRANILKMTNLEDKDEMFSKDNSECLSDLQNTDSTANAQHVKKKKKLHKDKSSYKCDVNNLEVNQIVNDDEQPTKQNKMKAEKSISIELGNIEASAVQKKISVSEQSDIICKVIDDNLNIQNDTNTEFVHELPVKRKKIKNKKKNLQAPNELNVESVDEIIKRFHNNSLLKIKSSKMYDDDKSYSLKMKSVIENTLGPKNKIQCRTKSFSLDQLQNSRNQSVNEHSFENKKKGGENLVSSKAPIGDECSMVQININAESINEQPFKERKQNMVSSEIDDDTIESNLPFKENNVEITNFTDETSNFVLSDNEDFVIQHELNATTSTDRSSNKNPTDEIMLSEQDDNEDISMQQPQNIQVDGNQKLGRPNELNMESVDEIIRRYQMNSLSKIKSSKMYDKNKSSLKHAKSVTKSKLSSKNKTSSSGKKCIGDDVNNPSTSNQLRKSNRHHTKLTCEENYDSSNKMLGGLSELNMESVDEIIRRCQTNSLSKIKSSKVYDKNKKNSLKQERNAKPVTQNELDSKNKISSSEYKYIGDEVDNPSTSNQLRKSNRHHTKPTYKKKYDSSSSDSSDDVDTPSTSQSHQLRKSNRLHTKPTYKENYDSFNSDLYSSDDVDYYPSTSNQLRKSTGHHTKPTDKENYDSSSSDSSDDVDNPSTSNQMRKSNQHHSKPTNIDNNKSSNSTSCSSDDEFVPKKITIPDLDLIEEPVEFTVPLLHSFESPTQLSQNIIEDLKSKGVVIKTGRFSAQEDTLLERNYKKFTSRFHVNDPHLLLGVRQRHKCFPEVRKFLKAKHFYVRLGEGLNDRQLVSIYKRARALYDPLRKKGKFDDNEVNNIQKRQIKKGNKWDIIGSIIGKPGNSVRSAFDWYDKEVNNGKWSTKEIEDLTNAIKIVSGIKDLSEAQQEGISWKKVADLVPTRNFNQCRIYWQEHLSSKLKGNPWNLKDYIKLISILSNECYVEDPSRIDWKRVQKCFGDSAPTWGLLRKKWYSLKKRLPHNNERDFRKSLDYLTVMYAKKNY